MLQATEIVLRATESGPEALIVAELLCGLSLADSQVHPGGSGARTVAHDLLWPVSFVLVIFVAAFQCTGSFIPFGPARLIESKSLSEGAPCWRNSSAGGGKQNDTNKSKNDT